MTDVSQTDVNPNQSEEHEDDYIRTKKTLAHRLYVGEISIQFIAKRKRWYIVSAIILLVCLLSLAFRGLTFGIEFSGGADFQAPTQVNSQTVDSMREAISDSGISDLDDTTVTTLGENTVRVQTRSLDPETEVPVVRQLIADEVGVSADEVAYSLIGASWGKQITQQGIMALGVFLVLVMALIWIYFRDLKMSIAAIAALVHDLILTLGVYSLVGFTFTPATLIGILTILGYSLYDTVVVFDKVRENVHGLSKTRATYAERANLAANQVLVRSVNTTIIGVLPVAALLVAGWFFLGTGPLKDLGLALFVGMVAGAYSSLFIATPLLVDMKEREPAMVEHRAAIERANKRSKRDGSDDGSEGGNPEGSGATQPKVELVVTPVAEVAEVAVGEEPDDESGEPSDQTPDSPPGHRSQPSRTTRSERKR